MSISGRSSSIALSGQLFFFFICSFFCSSRAYAEIPAQSVFYSINEEDFSGITPVGIVDADTLSVDTLCVSSVPSSDMAQLDLSRSQNPNWWWKRLRSGTLALADTSIIYPRFLKFCVNVYNWANHAFNYYDPAYVQGTGRRWKARLVNENWVDSYAMDFEGNVPIWMLSEPYSNLGFYVQYMAVSLGYSIDMSNVIGNKPLLHKRFEFAFTCARFYAEGYYTQNTGGTYLRRFGDYNDGHIFKKHIPGVSFESVGVNTYYFFNHSRYSQGCVYGFSNLQKRSAGSFIAGLSISHHDINVNFSSLPEEMLQYLNSQDTRYRFFYNDYSLLAGYGYNLVFAKNFVYNITVLPMFGFKHCFTQCSGGKRDMWSLNILGRMGLVYNFRDFFAGLATNIEGHWFRGSDYNFFNSVETLSLSVGVRF